MRKLALPNFSCWPLRLTNAVGRGSVPVPLIVVAAPAYVAAHTGTGVVVVLTVVVVVVVVVFGGGVVVVVVRVVVVVTGGGVVVVAVVVLVVVAVVVDGGGVVVLQAHAGQRFPTKGEKNNGRAYVVVVCASAGVAATTGTVVDALTLEIVLRVRRVVVVVVARFTKSALSPRAKSSCLRSKRGESAIARVERRRRASRAAESMAAVEEVEKGEKRGGEGRKRREEASKHRRTAREGVEEDRRECPLLLALERLLFNRSIVQLARSSIRQSRLFATHCRSRSKLGDSIAYWEC